MQHQLIHQMMQHQQHTAAFNSITTDHIQQYLDENKALILNIVENQNTGKFSECAENQTRLQHNLMYLAAIADCQPKPSSVHPQQQYTNSMQQQMVPQSHIAFAQQPAFTVMQSQLGMGCIGEGSGGFPDFSQPIFGEGSQGIARPAWRRRILQITNLKSNFLLPYTPFTKLNPPISVKQKPK